MVRGLRFGLEGEYLLVEQETYRPLWHPDLSFAELNAILEGIDYRPLVEGLSLEGLELDPPHRRIMPFYVEGYGLPGEEMTRWVDLLPKGVEVRTPVAPSLEVCLEVYEALYQALQARLQQFGYRAIALSHHPLAGEFRGPQNHPRHDWWQWGMQAMMTYGPDLNLSLPEEYRRRFDWERLVERANYYAPALVAFSLASPVGRGRLWQLRGRQGLSLRTWRRSPFAPALAAHPKEQGRLEFKAFDMPWRRCDFAPFFLLWLWLVLDERAPGKADDATRIYDLGNVARLGWDAEEIVPRAEEALERATRLLSQLDIDPSPLALLRDRIDNRATPADVILGAMQRDASIPALMKFLDALASQPASRATAALAPAAAW